MPRVYQRKSLKMQRMEHWFRENFSPPFLWAFPWIAPNHMTSRGGIRLCLLSLCQTVCVYPLEKMKDFPCLPCKSEKCLSILSFHRSHLPLSCCKIQLTCAFRNDNSQISELVHFLHDQPHLFRCQFERRDIWIFFVFSLQNSPPSIFLAETDTGISEGGKISGYILKLYIFLAFHVTNPINIYPPVLYGWLWFAMPAVFWTAQWGVGRNRNSGKVADNILLGGPHSVGETDDYIHGNKTHDRICEKQTNKNLNCLCSTGRKGGRRGEMNGQSRIEAYTPLHVRWIDSRWKFAVGNLNWGSATT